MKYVRKLIGGLVTLLGLLMAVGGGYLITLGGSFYYLPVGVVLAVSGVLAFFGNTKGLWLYAIAILATAIWAVWEAGFSFWGLLPRLGLIVFLGVCLCITFYKETLVTVTSMRGRLAALGALVVLVGGVVAANTYHNDEVLPPSYASADASRVRDAIANGDGEWRSFGGTESGTRFAALDQINPDNVKNLKVAWTYRTGDYKYPDENGGVEFEDTPLAIGGKLYVCTPHYMVDALDADTGKRLWRFDPKNNNPNAMVKTCRGVAYAKTSAAAPSAPGSCGERIILYTGDARLMAIDAQTGSACSGFGQNGTVDLTKGIGEIQAGYLAATSPPAIVNGLAVIGSQVVDNARVNEPSGVIRAYNLVTGELAWAWDLARPDRTGLPPEGETYTRATPNAWGPISADEANGLVFIPLGNETPDFYAGHLRNPASEEYTDAIVALDARTGRERWHFQTTHHDTWDYDLPAQPVLIDWQVGDERVPAVLLSTKRGEFFVLDRMTGKPLMPVVEQPVPTSDPLPGEYLSPTQPYSPGMPQVNTHPYREDEMWGMSPIDQLQCRIKFKQLRYDGQFTPQSLKGSLNDPGNAGYMDWGGVSIDLARRLMVFNSIRLPFVLTAVPRAEAKQLGVSSAPGASEVGGITPQEGTPFANQMEPFLSFSGVPCIQPPWGYIQAVDLDTHETIWKHPFGTGRDNGPFGTHYGLPIETGVPSQGGSVTTKTGLTFISATLDQYLRAFDARTGKELWRGRLPARGQAGPMSYRSAATGKQYVVIAAGGHAGLMTRFGDTLVAYALPDKQP